jgi:hypothetical protein
MCYKHGLTSLHSKSWNAVCALKRYAVVSRSVSNDRTLDGTANERRPLLDRAGQDALVDEGDSARQDKTVGKKSDDRKSSGVGLLKNADTRVGANGIVKKFGAKSRMRG